MGVWTVAREADTADDRRTDTQGVAAHTSGGEERVKV